MYQRAIASGPILIPPIKLVIKFKDYTKAIYTNLLVNEIINHSNHYQNFPAAH